MAEGSAKRKVFEDGISLQLQYAALDAACLLGILEVYLAATTSHPSDSQASPSFEEKGGFNWSKGAESQSNDPPAEQSSTESNTGEDGAEEGCIIRRLHSMSLLDEMAANSMYTSNVEVLPRPNGLTPQDRGDCNRFSGSLSGRLLSSGPGCFHQRTIQEDVDRAKQKSEIHMSQSERSSRKSKNSLTGSGLTPGGI